MKENRVRLDLIDTIRGITIISMIGFHACWILWYFGIGITSEQLFGTSFTIWERTICCSFIFISGFCYSLGKKQLKNGILILSLGVAITILSVIFAYDIRDIFGVLWLLGASVLLMLILDKCSSINNINRTSAICLFFVFLFIFVFCWNINKGYLGIGSLLHIKLPESLYSGLFMTFLGFQDKDFYSVDYFSIIPWFFLYLTGFFFHKIVRDTKFEKKYLVKGLPILKWMGRHSLLIYLTHPVVLYIFIFLISRYVK